jgi:hypothetical protein
MGKENKTMNIYLIRNLDYETDKYDMYDSAVVYAPDERTARMIYPGSGKLLTEEIESTIITTWTNNPNAIEVIPLASDVQVSHFIQGNVICASFNAG